MKLVRIAKGAWQVWAVCDPRGRCPVLDFLHGIKHEPMTRRMLALMREYIPEHGPPFHNQQKAKRLKGRVCELKTGPKRGAELRVTFFREGQVIVCVEAFTKGASKTPFDVIEHAEKVIKEFESAFSTRRVEILNPEDLE